MNIRIGLDIDGVITAVPNRFADFSKRLIESGADVRIVTSRSEQARAETVQELKSYGLKYSTLFFLPPILEAQCPHTRLSWYERWLWQKVDYAIRENLTHFIDDDAVIERLFVTYALEIAFLRYSDSIPWQQTNDFVSGNPK